MDPHDQLAKISPSLARALRTSGYSNLESLSQVTVEEFLSTVRVNYSELQKIRDTLRSQGLDFKEDKVRYPFINPMLLQQVASEGIDLSQTSLSSIGLPSWAQTPLASAGITTVQDLASASTFYIRAILGYVGRSQALVKQYTEEYLMKLLRLSKSHEVDNSLENLQLSPRIRGILRRAGIFTADQLYRLTDEELLKLKGIGKAALEEIKAVKLGDADNKRSIEEEKQRLEDAGIKIPSGISEHPISKLPLSMSIIHRLELAGIKTIGDITGENFSRLQEIPRIGKVTAKRILEAIQSYSEQLPAEVELSSETTQEDTSITELDKEITKLIQTIKSPRVRRVLEARFGVSGKILTLQEIGAELKLSKERVRQLEERGLRLIRKQNAELITRLIAPAVEAMSAVGGVATLRYLLDRFHTTYKVADMNPAGAARFLFEVSDLLVPLQGRRFALREAPVQQVEDLQELMKGLLVKRLSPMPIRSFEELLASNSDYVTLKTTYPNFSLEEFVRATPGLYITPSGDVALQEWKRTKIDNIVMALREIGKPAHYKTITRHVIDHLQDSTSPGPISTESIHNILLTEPYFIRLGRGLFGLTEWGTIDKELESGIENLMLAVGKPMHAEEIAEAMGRDPKDISRVLIASPKFIPIRENYWLFGEEYDAKSVSSRHRLQKTVRELVRTPAGSIVARIQISRSTYRSGSLAVSSDLHTIFPSEGEIVAKCGDTQESTHTYRLRRGRSHISGLRMFMRSHQVTPGQSIYIEALQSGEYRYRLYTEEQWARRISQENT